ncbi:MAG TPA: hypothetical protein VFW66_14105 [Gemmatimonadales bacterium]|nr:hypothetical protein [Gemmatimonadales bacterium]
MAHSAQADIRDVLAQLAVPSNGMLLAVGRHVVPLSNLDKPLWPGRRRAGITKRDLLRYVTRVSPWLLPHLEARPVFVTRFPDGIAGGAFYQKVWEERPRFVKTVAIWSRERGAPRDYLTVANLATLLWLAQQAALELHVWFSRTSPRPDGRRLGTDYADSEAALDASRLNYPDFIVVDLDSYHYAGTERGGAEPELNPVGFARVREIAFEVRRVAEALGLTPFVKTSGRTGLHCYLPIVRRYTFAEVRGMAEVIGQFLMALRPDDITLEWSVRARTGRVFFDFNQNVRGKSLAAAYSPRRHPYATVSMPLTWSELAHAYPTDYTLDTAPELLAERGDPWAGILHAKEDPAAAYDALAAVEAE